MMKKRKMRERVEKKLEERLSFCKSTSYGNEIVIGMIAGLELAIEIVKEELDSTDI